MAGEPANDGCARFGTKRAWVVALIALWGAGGGCAGPPHAEAVAPSPGPAVQGEPAAATQPGTTVIAQPPPLAGLQAGDRVWCRWKGGSKEYAGQVAEVRGDQIFVHYDDGDRELTTPSLCRKDEEASRTVADFPVGARVHCHWKGGPTEYPGTVAAVEGDRLFVHYDDGDQERILPSLCRAAGAAEPGATLYEIVSSSNPGGGNAYQGQVAVRKQGDVFDLHWTIQSTPPYRGVGIQEGNVLAVGWGTGSGHGVVVYRIQGGTLRGRWASPATQGRVGTEDLQGPPGLKGTYQIVASQSPIGGGSYTGTVTIEPTGDTYRLQWQLPRESYGGVGIRRGDVLAVGWGSGKGAGVVAYTVRPDGYDGVWATPGGQRLGTEVLKRKAVR